MHDCEQCVKKTIDLLGGLDIIVANAVSNISIPGDQLS